MPQYLITVAYTQTYERLVEAKNLEEAEAQAAMVNISFNPGDWSEAPFRFEVPEIESVELYNN